MPSKQDLDANRLAAWREHALAVDRYDAKYRQLAVGEEALEGLRDEVQDLRRKVEITDAAVYDFPIQEPDPA